MENYCIKCGELKSFFAQDSRGCESFKMFDETGLTTKDIFICSKCISKFQYVKDVENLSKEKRSPKCHICGFQTIFDMFCSEAWLQIPYSVDDGEHGNIIWVCPDCIAKKANVS